MHVWVPGSQLVGQRKKGRKGRWRAAVDGPALPASLAKLSAEALQRGTILTVHAQSKSSGKNKMQWVPQDRQALTCDIRLANGKVLRHIPSKLCVVALGDEGLLDPGAQPISRKLKKTTPLVLFCVCMCACLRLCLR